MIQSQVSPSTAVSKVGRLREVTLAYPDASEMEVTKSHKGSSTTAIEEKRETEDSQPEAVPMQQLPQDADTDTAPFPFKPYELTHMLDPKNSNVVVTPGVLTAQYNASHQE